MIANPLHSPEFELELVDLDVSARAILQDTHPEQVIDALAHAARTRNGLVESMPAAAAIIDLGIVGLLSMLQGVEVRA